MKKIFAAAALLLAMTACGGSQKKALPLEGTTWKLAKMEAIPAKAIDAEADFFTLQFSAADTLVSGRTNCNRFFGKYELKGQKLEFENLGMTRMACPEMQYEDAFVKMLDEVDGYEIKGEELKFYDDKKLLAEFRAVQDAAARKRDFRLFAATRGRPPMRGVILRKRFLLRAVRKIPGAGFRSRRTGRQASRPRCSRVRIRSGRY